MKMKSDDKGIETALVPENKIEAFRLGLRLGSTASPGRIETSGNPCDLKVYVKTPVFLSLALGEVAEVNAAGAPPTVPVDTKLSGVQTTPSPTKGQHGDPFNPEKARGDDK